MALPAPADGSGPCYFGVYPAIVTDIVDTGNLGRIEVRFPSLGKEGDRDVRAWATLCTPYADNEQGLAILPEVGSQVVVAFEAGNWRRPYIVGAAWNGKAALPHKPEPDNNIRLLRSRSGSTLEFDDTANAGKVSITMASGHQVVLDNSAQEVTVKHANGCVIQMTSTGSIKIQATASVEVTAPMLVVKAPESTFSGTVVCQTLIATSVISASYTPGVGNLL